MAVELVVLVLEVLEAVLLEVAVMLLVVMQLLTLVVEEEDQVVEAVVIWHLEQVGLVLL